MSEIENKMSLEDFEEQEKFCMENNVPDGRGCSGCPGENSVCADNIRNLIGKLKDQRWYIVLKERPGYSVSIEMYGFDRDVLALNLGGMEYPDLYELISEEELYKRITEAV